VSVVANLKFANKYSNDMHAGNPAAGLNGDHNAVQDIHSSTYLTPHVMLICAFFADKTFVDVEVLSPR
jgi:hypothetical protein